MEGVTEKQKKALVLRYKTGVWRQLYQQKRLTGQQLARLTKGRPTT